MNYYYALKEKISHFIRVRHEKSNSKADIMKISTFSNKIFFILRIS